MRKRSNAASGFLLLDWQYHLARSYTRIVVQELGCNRIGPDNAENGSSDQSVCAVNTHFEALSVDW